MWMSTVGDVSKVRAASIFSVQVCTVSKFCDYLDFGLKELQRGSGGCALLTAVSYLHKFTCSFLLDRTGH